MFYNRSTEKISKIITLLLAEENCHKSQIFFFFFGLLLLLGWVDQPSAKDLKGQCMIIPVFEGVGNSQCVLKCKRSLL